MVTKIREMARKTRGFENDVLPIIFLHTFIGLVKVFCLTLKVIFVLLDVPPTI
jgi:hypothetical protein